VPLVSPSPNQICVKCPDLNGDGLISNDDGSLLYSCAGVGDCPEEYDLNEDGIVSILSDVSCITDYLGKDSDEIDVCEVIINECPDGTPVNECSNTLPLFCNDELVLEESCEVCGCPPSNECQEDGSCIITENSACVQCPDLNNDGIVNNDDGVLFYNCAGVGNCPENYDLNDDGIISILSDSHCLADYLEMSIEEIEICSCDELYSRISSSWFKSCNDENYDPVADINKDTFVNALDLELYNNNNNKVWCAQALYEDVIWCEAEIVCRTPNNCSEYLLWDNSYFTKIIVHPLDDSTIFAIGDHPIFGELYFSKDGGKTWSYKMDNIRHLVFDNIDTNIVYGSFCLGSIRRLYRSDDGGETFIIVNDDLPLEHCVGKILPDKFVENKIYIASSTTASSGSDDWGYYTSEDGGENLEFVSFRDTIQVPEEYYNVTLNSITWDMDQDPQDSDIIYFGQEGGPPHGGWNTNPYLAVRTLDGGLTFENFSQGLPWHSISTVAYVGLSGATQWIMGTEGSGIYILNTSTNAWMSKPLTHGRAITDYIIDTNKPEIHYYADRRYIFRSEDYGDSWTTILYGSDLFITDLDLDSKGNLYFVSFGTIENGMGGIYRIVDVVNSNEGGRMQLNRSSGDKDGRLTIEEETSLVGCDSGCLLDSECFPIGTRANGEYCSINGDLAAQKQGRSQCANNFECKSNSCLDGQCVEEGFLLKIFSWLRKLFGDKLNEV